MEQPNSYRKMMRDYAAAEAFNALRPETRRYLKEARSIASYRQNRLEDVQEAAPLTAEERQYFNVADLALRLRATTLRLDSLALRGAAALLLLLALAMPVKAEDAVKKPREKPQTTISVKVYPGRPASTRKTAAGCIAWAPTLADLDSGWSACKKLLGSKP